MGFGAATSREFGIGFGSGAPAPDDVAPVREFGIGFNSSTLPPEPSEVDPVPVPCIVIPIPGLARSVRRALGVVAGLLLAYGLLSH